MKNSSNLNISCKVIFSLNKWNKKVGSPSLFGRKRPFISLNRSASIETLSSSERVRTTHAKNDAQKGCAMQLNGITLRCPQLKSQTTILPFSKLDCNDEIIMMKTTAPLSCNDFGTKTYSDKRSFFLFLPKSSLLFYFFLVFF